MVSLQDLAPGNFVFIHGYPKSVTDWGTRPGIVVERFSTDQVTVCPITRTETRDSIEIGPQRLGSTPEYFYCDGGILRCWPSFISLAGSMTLGLLTVSPIGPGNWILIHNDGNRIHSLGYEDTQILRTLFCELRCSHIPCGCPPPPPFPMFLPYHTSPAWPPGSQKSRGAFQGATPGPSWSQFQGDGSSASSLPDAFISENLPGILRKFVLQEEEIAAVKKSAEEDILDDAPGSRSIVPYSKEQIEAIKKSAEEDEEDPGYDALVRRHVLDALARESHQL